MRHVYFFITMDCDTRIGNNVVQKEGILTLFDLYNELNLRERVTWFINNNDFNFTTVKKDILLEISHRGDSVGIHDHFESANISDYKSAKIFANRSLKKIIDFYDSNGIKEQIISHRNGCLSQFSYVYKVLIELGYKVVSDVWPGKEWCSKMIAVDRKKNKWQVDHTMSDFSIHIDNSHIPLNGTYWIHNENNAVEYTSREGSLIQLPIVGCGGPCLDRKAILETIKNNINNEVFLAWDIHPYDIQDEISQKTEKIKVNLYKKDIEWLINEYNPIFININDFYFNIFQNKF